MDSDVVKMAKSLKRKYVEITPNCIYGLDETMSLFSVIYAGGDEFFAGDIGEISTGKEVEDRERLEQTIIQKMDACVKGFIPITNTEPVVVIEDLKENEDFNEILNLRATDGAKKLIIDNKFLMYMHGAMHPVTKTDSISLKIYLYDSISFIAEFIVDKKKYQIHEFVRYRYF